MNPRPGTGTAEPAGPWAQSAALAFRFLFAVVCLLALGWMVSNILQVPPDARAVVVRFGSVVRQKGAGLLLAWPQPIERVRMLPAADRQIEHRITRFDADPGISLASNAVTPADFALDTDARRNAGFLLTGDLGVVHLQATVFYQISDPAAYVIAREHVGPALERLFVAAAVTVCAARDINAILVARPEGDVTGTSAGRPAREDLRADLVRAVNRRLADLAEQGAGLGITVSRVDLAAALPGNAKAAFDQVLTVTQAAEEAIARARTYAEMKAQEAAQDHDRTLTEARAAAAEELAQAEARTASISALTLGLAEPSAQALLNRTYSERIGVLLRKARQIETVDPQGGVHLLLPGSNR
jgi:regulator of protease activity HflC (stomatin/prohibitin superfamily)